MDRRRQAAANGAAKRVALSALVAALTLICLAGAGMLPTSRLALYALSGLFIGALMVEGQVRGAILTVLGVGILGFFILPDKTAILPYACFFGWYGVAKYYLDGFHSRLARIALKALAFNLGLGAGYLLVTLVFGLPMPTGLWLLGLWAGAQAGFGSYAAFLRAFRQTYNALPSELKERGG